MALDPTALYKISYGIFIVCAADGDKINGQICNTVFQITSEPPVIAISVNKENYTHQFIENGGAFTVSILAQSAPLKLIGAFGFKCGRNFDKFEDCQSLRSPLGIPYITEHTVSYLEAKVVQKVDAGTHTLFLGEVVNGETFSDEAPMTYAYYHEVKNGHEPATAPTFRKAEENKVNNKEADMKKYVCTACNWIYNPALGDPDGGIEPGTAFEDIPEDWVCPICGVGKDMFEETD